MTPDGRRSVVLVRPVRVTAAPPWAPGPLPLRVGDLTATADRRSGYFSAPCNRILYGTPARPTRWHRPAGEPFGTADLFGVELLVPDPDDPHAGLLVAHLADSADVQLDLVRAAAGRRGAVPAPDLQQLAEPFGTVDVAARTFTVAFRSSTGPATPPPDLAPELPWTAAQGWLWQLATRASTADYPPDPDHGERHPAGTVRLSADWRALIGRDGAAFVALRPDRGAGDPFLAHAHQYAHTTYLDALLLGMIQRASVERMVLASAAAFDAPDLGRHLEHLQARAARFRTIYWLRDASSHGHANSILDAYHAAHELPERFAAVLSEIADLNRTVQAREAEHVAAALGVLTVVGLPAGIALETLQALDANSPRDLALAAGFALTVTAGLFCTRVGRLLIRQIRAWR